MYLQLEACFSSRFLSEARAIGDYEPTAQQAGAGGYRLGDVHACDLAPA
jgi:hypothetical protein